MKVAYKIIYWCALTFIALTIMIWAAVKWIPLEFQESKYEEHFGIISFFGIAIAIMATATRAKLKGRDRKGIQNSILNRFLIVILYFVVGVIYFAATALDGMCAWSTSAKLLFEKKSNPVVKLVQRDFGCGAVDGTLPAEGFFIRTPITPFFFYYTPVDTTKIDSTIWAKAHA